jgi:hypothetical protein
VRLSALMLPGLLVAPILCRAPPSPDVVLIGDSTCTKLFGQNHSSSLPESWRVTCASYRRIAHCWSAHCGVSRKVGSLCWRLVPTTEAVPAAVAAKAEESEFCPKVSTGLDLITAQCGLGYTYKVIIVFLGANDLKVINYPYPAPVAQESRGGVHAHSPSDDLRLLVEAIASSCPRTLGVVLVDPLPLLPNRSLTQRGGLWDLSVPGRETLSADFASAVGDVAFELRNKMSPRLHVGHVPSAALAQQSPDAWPHDGVHYSGYNANGTHTALHRNLAAAIESAVRRILADRAVLQHHEHERLKARAAAAAARRRESMPSLGLLQGQGPSAPRGRIR